MTKPPMYTVQCCLGTADTARNIFRPTSYQISHGRLAALVPNKGN